MLILLASDLDPEPNPDPVPNVRIRIRTKSSVSDRIWISNFVIQKGTDIICTVHMNMNPCEYE
jgi:hypothetical protein